MTTRPEALYRRHGRAILLGWSMGIAVDFFLHGGLLAGLYEAPDPFLLDPESAFRRIPLGYLALLGLTAGLQWLVVRVDARGWREGGRLGAAVGGLLGSTTALALFSITSAALGLLASWAVAQAFQLALVGGTLGAIRDGSRVGRWVAVAFAASLLATALLQSIRG